MLKSPDMNVQCRYMPHHLVQAHININKTKVLLPQAWVTLADFGYPVYALWFYCSQNFKLFRFSIFRF